MEQTEYDPISEPLLVNTLMTVGLECIEAHEHGVNHAQESCQDGQVDEEKQE